jgi:hypothetical protein
MPGHVIGEKARAEGGAKPRRLVQVLDADGQAVQRPQRVAALHGRLGRTRASRCRLRVLRDDGVEHRIDRLDALHARRQQLDGRDFLAAYQAPQLAGAEIT